MEIARYAASKNDNGGLTRTAARNFRKITIWQSCLQCNNSRYAREPVHANVRAVPSQKRPKLSLTVARHLRRVSLLSFFVPPSAIRQMSAPAIPNPINPRIVIEGVTLAGRVCRPSVVHAMRCCLNPRLPKKKTADLCRSSEGNEIGGDGAGGVEANPLRHRLVIYACAAAWAVEPIALIAAERRLL